MSSNQNGTLVGEDKIVTDSVHERMKENTYAFCEQCKEGMTVNIAVMDAHFRSKDHRSYSDCVYCHGKVYPTVICHIGTDGNETKKDDFFHRCTNTESASIRK